MDQTAQVVSTRTAFTHCTGEWDTDDISREMAEAALVCEALMHAAQEDGGRVPSRRIFPGRHWIEIDVTEPPGPALTRVI